MEILDCYVDGSYDETLNRTKWAFIVVKNNAALATGKGGLTGHSFCEGRQIAGELMAVGAALRYAKANKVKLNVFFDYQGVYMWVIDLFDQTRKPWKANKEYSIRYRQRVAEEQRYINSFTHVKGHSGNTWNEFVDKLAKYG